MAAGEGDPLLPPALSAPVRRRKRRFPAEACAFGYLPSASELFPVTSAEGQEASIDCGKVVVNIVIGCVTGLRLTLSAIMGATLVFTTSGVPEVTAMFPLGISLMWYTTIVAVLWYCIFGRLQYGIVGPQDLVHMLLASAVTRAGLQLQDTAPERIPATVLAIIATSSFVAGLSSLLVGQLGLGKYMMLVPKPVTSGFLGSIGFFVLRSSLQVSSGVHFKYFYPANFDDFIAYRSLSKLACQFGMVILMRYGPGLLKGCFPKSKVVKILGGLVCQLFPLVAFYIFVFACNVEMVALADGGWTYPAQSSGGPLGLWETYNLRDADVPSVVASLPVAGSAALMTLLGTMTGVLGVTAAFGEPPNGDPEPDEAVDFSLELATMGLCDIVLSLSGGIVAFHRVGSSVGMRYDGGSHRVAQLAAACFVAVFFISSIPVGQYVPKWFLGGLLMHTSVGFLGGALGSYKNLPRVTVMGMNVPSPQYAVTLCCIIVAVFSDPTKGIAAGVLLSITIFLYEGASSHVVRSLATGDQVISLTKRPWWEMQILHKEGKRVIILALAGNLFFGSVQSLRRLAQGIVESDDQDIAASLYLVLDFKRCTGVDSSCTDYFKTAVKKAQRTGRQIVFCQMRKEIVLAFQTAKVITNLDKDLEAVVAGTEQAVPQVTVADPHDIGMESMFHDTPATLTTLSSGDFDTQASDGLEASASFHPFLAPTDFDAFDTLTDALDYCGAKIISEFLYGECTNRSAAGSKPTAGPPPRIEPYQKAYREAVRDGRRIDEEVFDEMNGLPRGTMKKLRSYCDVQNNLRHGQELKGGGALLFVLQGVVSLVERRTEETALERRFGTRIKGFGGRGGASRLRGRWLAGHTVGRLGFFLGERLVQQLSPSVIVSAKLTRTAEVWTLSQAKYDALPADLRDELKSMCLFQMADEAQHWLLSSGVN